MSRADALRARPAGLTVKPLTSDEKHIGVIWDRETDNRIKANAYLDNGGMITFGIYLGDRRWTETDLTKDDANRFALLILHKTGALLAEREGHDDG
jgi:hypothetical protein